MDARQEDRKITILVWICGNCEEEHETQTDAEDCCADLICMECDKVHDTQEKAEVCCD